jgi:hypothetical protein
MLMTPGHYIVTIDEWKTNLSQTSHFNMIHFKLSHLMLHWWPANLFDSITFLYSDIFHPLHESTNWDLSGELSWLRYSTTLASVKTNVFKLFINIALTCLPESIVTTRNNTYHHHNEKQLTTSYAIKPDNQLNQNIIKIA